MKTPLAVFVALFLSGLVLAQTPPTAPAGPPEPSVAERALDAYQAGWKAGKFDAFVAMLANDVRFHVAVGGPPFTGEPKPGAAALRERLASLAARGARLDFGPSRTVRFEGGAMREGAVLGTVPEGGEVAPLRTTIALAVVVKDGKVTEFREYLGGRAEGPARSARGAQGAEANWVRAFVTGDAETLGRLTEPDALVIDGEGIVLTAEAFATRSRAEDRTILDWAIDDSQLRELGNVAVWSGTVRVSERIRTVDRLTQYRVTAVWAHSEAGWKLRLRQFTPVRA